MKKKNDFVQNIKKTWVYMKDCKKSLVGYMIVCILEGIISIIAPMIEAQIVLNITSEKINQLLYTAFLIFVTEAVLYILFYKKGFFYQKIYQTTLVNLQLAIAKETLKLEVSEIDKETSGLFIDRLNHDTEEISSMFMEYTYWLSNTISNIGIFVAILILSRHFFFYTIITAIILFLVSKKRLSKRYKIFKQVKKLQEQKIGLTSELVRGIRDIKVLNAHHTVLKQTNTKIRETATEEIKMIRISRLYMLLENNLKNIFDFLFLLLGILLYKNKLLAIPTFVVLYTYQTKTHNFLEGVNQLMEYSKKFVVSASRIYEVIENERFKKETFGNIKKKKLEGHIEFKNVEFKYENKKVIDQMNFEIKPNEKVAFVGKSGAGKTTIFNLITKLYHINKGEILLDGINIEDLDASSLRNNMSIITQSPYIFNFSIKENLLLAKENATMKEIRNACKMACIDDFIMNLEEKYDTILGENGVILSGGQKQRIAIARALLMKTEIILLDEATSSLDNETQNEIQDAIDNLKGEYTILIVAHRLSTVIDSDKIFVVKDGKILDQGTHKSLLKKCDFYKSLYEKDLKV